LQEFEFKIDEVSLVAVPDVVGLTEAAAATALTTAGLVSGTVTTASSTTVAAGLVISQSPASGASVAPGSAVDYVVSTGPAGPAPPPVYVIGIGEVEVVPLLATFRIQETIDAPDTMIADVFSVATGDAGPSLPAYQARVLADGASAYWPLDDPEGSTTARDLVGTEVSALSTPFLRFALGLPVVVTENGVRIFGGVVTGTRERGLTGPSATDLVVEIQATSYELSAARRVITAAISQDGAETIGAAFATLVTDYYAEVDVTLHPDQVAGPALPAATFTRSRGDAVNKHLASSVGYLQSIDFENRLRAWAPGDVLAPDNYDEAVNPELLTGDITVERQLQNGYANRVILTGDPIPVPGHVDHFTGDGTTDTWPVTYQVNGPYPYFVDGAVAQGVIQYPATSTTEAIGGVEAPVGFQWEYDPIALTIHRRLGPVAAGVAFDFPYDGLFIPAGSAEDAAEIAALGLWEHVENVTAVITDVSAQGYAEALLAAKIASKDEIVRLQTRALGFHPGQTMTIASFSRELSGDYLITQVDTGSESGGILLVRSITASKSQNNTHDWRRVYQQWAGASAATEST
jgi:PASTA domain